MGKNKNALTAEIRAYRMELLWNNIKLISWCIYSLFHIIMIPTAFAVVFGKYAPFFLPVILFVCHKELKLISDAAHPINTKIESIRTAKNEIRAKIESTKSNFNNPLYQQVSLFDGLSVENCGEGEILTHTISTKHGYYKDVTVRTEENSDLIDKWLDKNTGCLYMVVVYQDDKPENISVTKDVFDTLYKSHFGV